MLPKRNTGVRNTGCHCPAEGLGLIFKKEQNRAQFRLLVAIPSCDQSEELEATMETMRLCKLS